MLFLDSSDPAEIADISRWGVVAGVTTNPLMLSREARGVDLAHRIVEVLRASRGPVCVELLRETEAEMLAEAQAYRAFDAPDALGPRPSEPLSGPASFRGPSASPLASPPRAPSNRVVIKVPFSEVGLQVTNALAGIGVPANVTCLMSFHQAYLAALAGATYVSIFSGRIRDMGYDPSPVIAETRAQLDREGLPAKIIVGSVRHLHDVSQALAAGAHIVTVPPPILRAMLRHPRTEETIREFNTAWAASRNPTPSALPAVRTERNPGAAPPPGTRGPGSEAPR
jgi:transaldolase